MLVLPLPFTSRRPRRRRSRRPPWLLPLWPSSRPPSPLAPPPTPLSSYIRSKRVPFQTVTNHSISISVSVAVVSLRKKGILMANTSAARDPMGSVKVVDWDALLLGSTPSTKKRTEDYSETRPTGTGIVQEMTKPKQKGKKLVPVERTYNARPIARIDPLVWMKW